MATPFRTKQALNLIELEIEHASENNPPNADNLRAFISLIVDESVDRAKSEINAIFPALPPPRGEAGPVRWEYNCRSFRCDYVDQICAELDRVGKDGWEAYAVEKERTDSKPQFLMFVYLKRPLPS